MNNVTTAPTVTVTHIPLTRDNYNLLLALCDTEEVEYGRNSRIDDARRWLHYRWWLTQSGQDKQPGAGE